MELTQQEVEQAQHIIAELEEYGYTTKKSKVQVLLAVLHYLSAAPDKTYTVDQVKEKIDFS